MGYLYSRTLAGDSKPEPSKPKKRGVPKKSAAPKLAAQPKPKANPTPPRPVQANAKVTNPIPLPANVGAYNIPERRTNNNHIVQHSPSLPTNKPANVNLELRNQFVDARVSNPLREAGTTNQSTPASKPAINFQPVPAKPAPTHQPVISKMNRDQNRPELQPRIETTKKVAEPVSNTRSLKKPKLSFEDDFNNQSPTNVTLRNESNTLTTTATSTPNKPRGPKGKAKEASTSTTTASSATPVERKQPGKRGRKRTIKPDDEEEGQQQENNTPKPTKRAYKPRRQNKELAILNGTYKLTMVFEGHTHVNVPAKSIDDDDLTDAKDIWCCEFEPPRLGDLKHNIVAMCGSYSVLFLDTQLGRYIKKYTHAEIQEIFYCMAWTTLSGSQLLNARIVDAQSCNILAVAGRLGSIKLLNPLQNECYRYLFGHQQAVLKMAFAKSEPRWLFSASADKTVRLWDIGSPTNKDDDSVCLAKFNLPPKTNVPTALNISHDLSTLLVGFDDGDMVSFKITPQLLDKFRTKSANLRDKDSLTGDKWHDFGPIATIEPKSMYPKGGEWHEGYIDDIYIFGQDGDTSSKLYNKVLSRGADDMEFIIWDPATSTKTDADILLSLEWPDSAGCTGARYKVIEAEGQKVLIAGEYDGQIHIYNVGAMNKSKTLADNSVEQFKPTRMLSHPMSSELIRDVTCSHDTRTIVAVDNNNTAFVWNCTD